MKISSYQIDDYIKNIADNKAICGALIYGPESGLAALRVNKIARLIVPDANDPFLIVNIFDKQINDDASVISDEFFSIPMIGGRKLIIINSIKNNVVESLKMIFGNHFNNTVQQNFILVIADDLDKNSSLRKFAESSPYIASLPCYEDSRATSIMIIQQKLRSNGLSYENGVVEIIADRFGKNRQIILGELDKLSLFMGAEKYVSCELVNRVIGNSDQISINEFVNSFAALDGQNACRILDKLFVEKINPITMIRYLTNYFSKLYNVRLNLDQGANLDNEIKEQKLFFKQEEFFKKHLNLWTASRISIVLYRLQKTEIACKSAGYNSELLLKAFVNGFHVR